MTEKGTRVKLIEGEWTIFNCMCDVDGIRECGSNFLYTDKTNAWILFFAHGNINKPIKLKAECRNGIYIEK